MKEIYFETKAPSITQNIKKGFFKASSYTLAKIYPVLSNHLAERLLCTPVRPKVKRRIGSGFDVKQMRILGHDVNIYIKGQSSKYILFSHGWSGNAFNFSSFYDDFLDAGYSVICFDQIAHGHSEGNISNYYYFYNVFETIYNELKSKFDILGVVGHSMGSSAIVGSKLNADIKLCLIAPLIPVFESLYLNTERFGISPLTVSNFLKSYEKRFSVKLDEIDPKNIISKLKNDLLIIHSEDDQFIDHYRNLPFYNNSQKESVQMINGLGHFRILKSKEVIDKCLSFLNS